ncbi:MAG: AMP-binding protein [Clostridiaceae bacterium]|nr:AMP-binding protein [Clostridiaceae bacterium]
MQTVTGKKYYDRPRFQTLRDLLRDCVIRYGDMDAYRYHETPGGPEITHSFRDFMTAINEAGTGLNHLGLNGKHMVIIGANCYEWAVSHNAVVNGLGVSVPLDRQLPEPEVIHLTARGNTEAFIYNATHHAIALAVAAANPQIRYFICMKPGVIDADLQAKDQRFINLADVMAQGRRLIAHGDRSYLDASIDPDALCSLLFTSGTTAMSKGVMLSHRNITGNVHAVVSTIHVAQGQRALSVLPLHHTFENTVGMYMMLAFGCCICFNDGLRYLAQNLKEWHINILLAVPLLYENIYRQIEKNIQKSGKEHLVRFMLKLSNGLRKIHIDLRKKLFHQILAGVGGGLNLCVCGAAAIDADIVRFFNDIGIEFLCGYGLTETAPVVAACNQHINVFGSVGNPLAFIEVAIDTESNEAGAIGEILTRSECVMLGYYQNPSASKEVMTEDGWFRTGDIGFLDEKNCIHITGRVKSMIVLTNGKKAFPEEIEFLLSHVPGIRESIVWGDVTSRDAVVICAKLVVNPDELPPEIHRQPEAVSAYFAEQIKLINQKMPSYKAIKYFILSEQELIKTTTLKVRRPLEQERINNQLIELGLSMKAAHGRSLD